MGNAQCSSCRCSQDAKLACGDVHARIIEVPVDALCDADEDDESEEFYDEVTGRKYGSHRSCASSSTTAESSGEARRGGWRDRPPPNRRQERGRRPAPPQALEKRGGNRGGGQGVRQALSFTAPPLPAAAAMRQGPSFTAPQMPPSAGPPPAAGLCQGPSFTAPVQPPTAALAAACMRQGPSFTAPPGAQAAAVAPQTPVVWIPQRCSPGLEQPMEVRRFLSAPQQRRELAAARAAAAVQAVAAAVDAAEAAIQEAAAEEVNAVLAVESNYVPSAQVRQRLELTAEERSLPPAPSGRGVSLDRRRNSRAPPPQAW
eukprot:TRINITY_DN54639_c0_g1_i1.p1 TRINITY_DN54639_c0_g1~~TRINITY_DN54639_c0_g1_i1.p1  ORF type:complete len:315 (+),score=68.48 TRINITY_DN54639_c0_g1_i1:73-1017(+)